VLKDQTSSISLGWFYGSSDLARSCEHLHRQPSREDIGFTHSPALSGIPKTTHTRHISRVIKQNATTSAHSPSRHVCRCTCLASQASSLDPEDAKLLDMQHSIIEYVLRRSYLSPVHEPRRVLDVGCGSGSWVKEFAIRHPKSTIAGFDLTAAFFCSDAPSNCSIDTGNLLHGKYTRTTAIIVLSLTCHNVRLGMPYPSGRFNFVHQRLLWSAIPANYWEAHINELYRVTSQGGFLELSDTDMQFHNVGDVGHRLNRIIIDCCASQGIDLSIVRRLDTLMRRAGLVDVQTRLVEFPASDWAGGSGRMVRTSLDRVLKDMAPIAVTLGAVASEEAFHQMLDAFWAECDIYGTILYGYYFYGQRRN
jgi:SAM-dependent methyltransferase